LPETSSKVVEVDTDNKTINVKIINYGEDELNLRQGDRIGVIRERSQPMQTTEVTTVPITEEMVQRGPLFS